MMKALIIDDEEGGRENIEALIGKGNPDLILVASANSAQSGIEAIKTHRPDVVFLDVEMPNGNGFTVLEQVKDLDFEVIFTTAYDQYALQAIKFAALDYLLKPIGAKEFSEAIEKVKQKKQQVYSGQNRNVLLENRSKKDGQLQKIALPTSEGFVFVEVADIIRCEADSCYTTFCLKNRTKIVVCRTLKEYEELLAQSNFFRVHQSHLINLNCISKYFKGTSPVLEMSDGIQIPVSKRKKDELLSLLPI